MNHRFLSYILHTEIVSTFHARVEYISIKQILLKPMGAKNPQNHPFSWATLTPSNTPIPRPTPLNTPNDSSITSHSSHNYTTKSPFITMKCPKFIPKYGPYPSMITTVSSNPPSTDPTYHPKWHPDPITRFATIHFPDRQTDRWDIWQLDSMSAYSAYAHYIDRELHANNFQINHKSKTWMCFIPLFVSGFFMTFFFFASFAFCFFFKLHQHRIQVHRHYWALRTTSNLQIPPGDHLNFPYELD